MKNIYIVEVIMLTFEQFLEKNYPDLFAEAKKEGLGGKLLKIAKKMPYTTGALLGSAAFLAGTNEYEKSKEAHDKPPIVTKEKLPPLKPTKSKVVATIEDAGTA